eukprot:scaffold75374_cov69-Phaeocystis_antarctica.AAC.10
MLMLRRRLRFRLRLRLTCGVWKPMSVSSCSSVTSAAVRILTRVHAPKENSKVVCAKMERKLSSGRLHGSATAVATRQRIEMPIQKMRR